MVVSLVEDDETVLSLLAELLRAHGHDPREVLIESGDTLATCLERIAANGAPVVILDLSMPVSGVEILSAAHADPRFAAVRWIIASARFDATSRIATTLPRVRFIAKPYDIPELLAAIKA